MNNQKIDKNDEWQHVLDALADPGYFVGEQFWPAETVAQCVESLQTLLEKGAFHPATIGKGAQAQRNEAIRGDSICWLEPDQSPAPLARYLASLEDLRQTLNREFMLGLHDFEVMAAHYGPGAHYGKHLDRFRADDARTVTAILYLNPAWQPGDGGELRIHLKDGQTLDVPPKAGTAVVFMSDGLEHEVLTTHQPRFTLTCWFKRRQGLPV